MLQIIENNKIGFIDSAGKVIIPAIYNSAGEFSEGLAPARIGGYYGYINPEGKFVIQPQFDYAESFSEGYAIAYKGEHSFYIDHKGKQTFENSFAVLNNFNKGRALVQTATKKFGIIDPEGQLLIDTLYKKIVPTEYDTYIVEGFQEHESGLIDADGKFIVPYCRYTWISEYLNGFSQVEEVMAFKPEYTSIKGFIDSKGAYVFGCVSDNEASIGENGGEGMIPMYFRKKDTTYAGFIDLQENAISKNIQCMAAYNFSNGRAVVESRDYKYRIINKRGELVTQQTFDAVMGYKFQDNVLFVKQDDKWGCIDTNGTFVIQPKFLMLAEAGFHKDYFFFNDFNKYGMSDMKGRITIPARFEEVDPNGFKHGVLQVLEDKRLGYVNMKGQYIWRQTAKKDISSLNTDFQSWGFFEVAALSMKGIWQHAEHSAMPVTDSLHFKPGILGVIIDTTKTCTWNDQFKGVKVYVVNTTKDTCHFDVLDYHLYMRIQALDKNNNWTDIQYMPSSWCGNSYFKTFPGKNEYWEFNVPVYEGEMRMKIRIKLSYEDDIIYSNVIEGRINPGQFWRVPVYHPGGIMDPYY